MPEPQPANPNPDPEPQPQPDPTLLGNPPEPPEPPKPEPSLMGDKVSPVNPDGTFIENWKATLPEELRDEKVLDTVTDFNNAIKQLVHHKKMVGKDKVLLPNEKSTEDEWNSFYEAIGRPKTETGYTVPQLPTDMRDDVKEIYNDDFIAEMKKVAYGLGATQKQFEAFLAYDMSRAQQLFIEDEEAQKKELAEAYTNGEKLLKAKWGMEYEQYMQKGNQMLNEYFITQEFTEEDRQEFRYKYGNDADFIQFVGTLGAKFLGEHSALIGESIRGRAVGDLQKRINELMKTKGYMQINSDMSREDRQAITDEIQQLQKQLSLTQKATA